MAGIGAGNSTPCFYAAASPWCSAVHAAKHGDRQKLSAHLLATFVLGARLPGLKLSSIIMDYREHLGPRLDFDPRISSTPRLILLLLYFA